MTLKEIKNTNAKDITFGKIPENLKLEKIALSFGIYGMNGGLFRDVETGELHKIIKRSSNLFLIA